jgi:hypothetical protein
MSAIFNNFPNIHWVFGARIQILGRKINRNPTRHYCGRIFATCASIVLNLPVYDTQCGAKMFRNTPILKKILENRFLTKWIFDVEMIARLIKLSENKNIANEMIYEYPLNEWTDVAGSKLKSSDFIKAINDLLIIRKFLKESNKNK